MRIPAYLILALGSVGLAGCGGSEGTGKGAVGDDKKQLATLLTDFNDTGSAATMAAYFAAGSKVSPAEHKKYVSMTYAFDGGPDVNGTAATGKVKMKNASDEKEVGVKEWTFVKEGDKWKIKTAPLP